MSTTYFQKPENALKRAEELIGVGQKSAALDVLETVIKPKRHRTWTATLEDILKKFLSLCTEARETKRAKEGLIQYRQIAQNASQGPESILKVVTSFIGDGERAVREAEEKAGLGAEAVASLQDLEADETPETMMLSVLTCDLSDTGRADRDNYVRWLRFLWESYRTCLEVLKNNQKLEELYADTAKKTFAFCVNYKRKVEFRRLKELLKTHLNMSQISQFSAQTESGLRLRLEIRAAQLNAATQLELWQLAFESAEDLHNVLSHPSNRKAQKSKVMMNYYDKLAQVFWVSENYLFHACAMQRIFHLSERQLNREVSKGDMTKEQAQAQLRSLASKVLLGAVSVPPPAIKQQDVDFDPEKDKQIRMAALVGHNNVPQRRSILSDVVAKNMNTSAYPELVDLFNVLEGDFDPLHLGEQMKPMFAFVEKSEELKKYLHPLKKVVLLKLIQQLSQVYVTMRIADFAKLADFMSLHDCEKFIVEAVAKNQAVVRLDHKNGTLNLGDKGLESENCRSQLANFAKGLQFTLDIIQKDLKEQMRSQKVEALKQLAERLEDERKMMSSRRMQIEERKETLEREMHLKAMEEDRKRKQEEEERRTYEEKRKEEDKRRREEAKLQQEREEKELAEKKRLKEQVDALKAEEKKGKGKKDAAVIDALGKSVEELDDDELKNIDKNALIKAKKEQEEKLKREAEERIQAQVIKMDHLERARRENERDLLAKVFEEQKEHDKLRWEVESKQFLENHKKKHEEDLVIKQRMLRMIPDKSVFEEMITKRREAQYERDKAEHWERTRKERERKKREREEREKREAEERARKEAEEAEKRRRMEEEKRIREEERARLDAMAEKQRQREAEIEARREKDTAPAAAPRETGRGVLERPPMDRGSDRWGGGDRAGDRGDRPAGDRWGGGDRGDRGDRPAGDRWGGGDRAGGDRAGGDRPGGDRWRSDRGGDRPMGDRPGGDRPRADDRWGSRGGGGGGGGGGDSWRRSDDRQMDRPAAAPAERPRLNLQPRSAPKDETKSSKTDDDGFTAVSKRR
ncbi:translation initiation factor 3, subunit A [Guillardia theta CCMP2712]|uniref:Translation initiation factor 3, subunit A n=1 Tax=Guillardia theta (strain CCMP2712) TaxID=905079 RepID=L1JW85_GUITC|nr:translation initiation factor 3, subunit A [Guillardia theta CCMP2712]EKX52821.1 translation initiation factor 3, subunit A [Guillardia theta CCMP2712]|eukprot:XP_005839801.1 translation initiation factor 3, subunit A [Guillardia theta CCMP2712]